MNGPFPVSGRPDGDTLGDALEEGDEVGPAAGPVDRVTATTATTVARARVANSAMMCGAARDGLMRSLGRDQLHVDVDRLDPRIGLDVAGDLVEHAPRVELRVG